jgi:hypothetical protein
MQQERSVISLCDYSIEMLKGYKRALMETTGQTKAIAWALYPIIIHLTANLIRSSHEKLDAGYKSGENNAVQDLAAIRDDINSLINDMLFKNAV